MPNTIEGTFSLRQMLYLTQTNAPTRFEYKKRDVLKKVLIKKVVLLNPDRPSEPTVTTTYESFSYPQYKPYYNPDRSRYARQKKVKHFYDNVLSLKTDENNKFSLDSTMWKYRLGSEKKWKDKPSQSLIKSIYHETARKWREQMEKDVLRIKRTVSDRQERNQLIHERKQAWRQQKIDHRKKAKYLDVGDYNSRVRGINGDAYTRVHPVLAYYGHLFGKNISGDTGDTSKPFLPKHCLALLDFLIRKGILV